MDPQPPLAASSEVMSPSGPGFATPELDAGQDGADLIPAMAASMVNGISPPQPLPGPTAGPMTSMTGAQCSATFSEAAAVPGNESGLLPTTAFEAAMQATTRPPQHPGQQGPFDRRLQGSYGAVNSSRASDVRRNPVENMSHQLEVVMQSGVQWFREAWRARSGTVVQQDPGVVPPAPVQPPLPADLGMTPEMRIDVNPRTPQQLQQIPTSWNGEGVRKERPLFSPQQLEAMARAQEGHPLLYGPAAKAPPSSSAPSDFQAEVRRQVEDYMREQQVVMRELLEDNRRLRARVEGGPAVPVTNERLPEGNDQGVPPPPRVVPPPPLPLQNNGSVGSDQGLPEPPVPPQGQPLPRPEGLQRDSGRGWFGGLLGAGRSVSPPDRREGVAPVADGATSAQRWLGPPPALPREMAILVEGMSQLQNAMVKQLSTDSSPKGPETVKPGAQLPQLPPLGEDSPIDYQDWLTQVEAIMADMSDSSRTWFSLVMREVEVAYLTYLKAPPIDRLSLKPAEPDHLVTGAYQRVHARAATMLMASLPSEVKSELVATRRTTVISILFRLAVLYQPAGEQERTLILRKLQAPGVATSASEAVTLLRSWDRWFLRSRAIGVVPPDPYILVKGLSGVCERVLPSMREASFRTSMLRSRLMLDQAPTEENAKVLQQHLLSEMEQAVAASPSPKVKASPTAPPGVLSPEIRGMSTEPSPTSSSDKGNQKGTRAERRAQQPCKFWFKTDQGCSRGNRCGFAHSMEGITDKEKIGRCLACSGKGHSAAACPTKTGDAGKGKGKGTGKDKGKTKENAEPKVAAATAPTSSTATSSTTTTSSPSPTIPPEIRTLLADTKEMLSVLTSAPTLKPMRVAMEASLQKAQALLLDSGATHLLRQARDRTELDNANPVVVTLAGDEGKVLHQSNAGTILTEPTGEPPQPIIPLGQLTEVLGCKLTWTKGHCKVVHPVMGALKVRLRNGCPEVVCQAQAMELVMELERRLLERNTKELEAKVLSLAVDEDKCWVDYAVGYLNSGSLDQGLRAVFYTPTLEPFDAEDRHNLVCQWDPETFDAWTVMKRSLQLPRRVRKRLMASSSWCVAFVKEKNGRDPLMAGGLDDTIVLRVDGEMERDPYVLELLTWAVATGRVTSVIGTDEPSTRRSLALRIWLYALAKVSGCGLLHGGFLAMTVDQEEEFHMNVNLALRNTLGMDEIPLGQTLDGRCWVGFTDMMEMLVLRGRSVDPSNLKPQPLALHQLRLRQALAGVLLSRTFRPKVAKMSATDRLMWAQHLKNGHVPYRRDCATCLQAAGVGKAHRRISQPQPFALSLDVAGPLKTKGRSMGLVDEDQLKYMLVGAYRLPKGLLTPGDSPHEEPGMDKLEKDDPLELDEELRDYVYSDASDEEELLPEEDFEAEAPKPQSPVESPVDPKEADDVLDKKIEELTSKVELATLYLMVPMRSRHTADVLEATQALYNKLKKANLPVMQVHSDRAREFRARSFRRWTIDKGLFHSRTSGSEPSANGTAECAVKFFKRRTRQLLVTAGADPKDWPLAAQHAAELHWRSMMPPDGQPRDPLPAFGQEVWYKVKNYAGSEEKKFLGPLPDLPSKWRKAVYRGIAPDVSGGHVLCRGDGGLVIAKGIRMDVIEPEKLDLLQPVVAVVPAEAQQPPDRRLREKTKGVEALTDKELDELLEFDKTEIVEDDPAPALSKATTEPERIHPAEEYAMTLLSKVPHGQLKSNNIHHLLNLLPDSAFPREELTEDMVNFSATALESKAKPRKCWLTGAYVHGGVVGLTRNTRSFPCSTQVVNRYIKQLNPNHQWTSVAIIRNYRTAMHKDTHNELGQPTMLAPITRFRRGGLWVPGEEPGYPVVLREVQGRKVPGHVLPVSKGPVKFNSREWHEVCGWSGNRVVIAAYTIRSGHKLDREDRKCAEAFGFRLPPCQELHSPQEDPPLPPPALPPALRPIRLVRDMMIKSTHITAERLVDLRLNWRDLADLRANMQESVRTDDFANKLWMERYNLRSAIRTGYEAGIEMPYIHPYTGRETTREYCNVVDCGHDPNRFYWYFTYTGEDFEGEQNIVIWGAEVERQFVITEEEMVRANWEHTHGHPHMGRRAQVVSRGEPTPPERAAPRGESTSPETTRRRLRMMRVSSNQEENPSSSTDQEVSTIQSLGKEKFEYNVASSSGLGMRVSSNQEENPSSSTQEVSNYLFYHRTAQSGGPLETDHRTAQSGGHFFEEIDGEVLLRMAQVEFVAEWTEEQREVSSVSPEIQKAEVSYTKNVEGILEELEAQGKDLEVVHNVEMSEVKRYLDRWRGAGEKEFYNLLNSKEAFTVKTKEQLPPGTLIVPGKAVATVKPPPSGGTAHFKRKLRFVVCGNFLQADEGDLYAAGADSSTLRLLLAHYAGKDEVALGTTDVHQAFVLTPWTGRHHIAVKPPRLAILLGLAGEEDLWLIQKALYGLKESPSMWAAYRDSCLRDARWSCNNRNYRLCQMEADPQLWEIRCELANGQLAPAEAHVLVYVDDMLMIGQRDITRSFSSWIAARWECEPPDWLGEKAEHQSTRFLGMEITKGPHGEFMLSQRAFIDELIRGHDYQGPSSPAMGSRETLLLTEEEEMELLNDPEEQSQDLNAVREAQKRVGELLWLSGRTRPDLQYPVALLSAKLLRKPTEVCRTAHRILGYLKHTRDCALVYGVREGDDSEDELTVFTDSSFSPSGGRSHGSAVICYKGSPIMWRSSRQQLTTLSTTESELIEALDGCLLATSVADIVTDLVGRAPTLKLKVDNYSAVQLLSGSTGSWRTRHLRVRSAWLRERIRSGVVQIQHEPGATQLADMGTKPLPRQRLEELRALWRLCPPDATPTKKPKVKMIVAPDGAKDVLRFLAALSTFCCAKAEDHGVAIKEPIQVNSSIEVYVIILVIGLVSVVMWEAAKAAMRRVNPAARLRALASFSRTPSTTRPQRLTRAECNELSGLMRVPAEYISSRQESRIRELASRITATSGPTARATSSTSVTGMTYGVQEEASAPYPTGAQEPQLPPRDPDQLPHPPPPPLPEGSATRRRRSNTPLRFNSETQTDLTGPVHRAFTRLEPEVRVERHLVRGPYFCLPDRPVVHFREDCWAFRHTDRRRIERRTLCEVCINDGQPQYPTG